MIYLLFIQTIAVLFIAPFMIGMVRSFKARFQNRKGPSIFLPYVSLLSLLRKEMTIPRHSSWVFRVVPFVVLGSAVMLALCVPSLAIGVVPETFGNIFLIAGVIAVGSVFLVMGGMDTGSTFGNMGSSREMTLASLVESSLFVTLTSFGLIAGVWHLDGIVTFFSQGEFTALFPIASVSLVALLLILLVENARYPVDNPATHLELTMVHEAMILEYSGPLLALLEYASAIKLTVFSILLANLILPFGLVAAPATAIGVLTAIGLFLVKLAAVALIIAFIESTVVKMRFYRMQEFLALVFSVAFAALMVSLISLHF
jgi:formate hydrogenlyase subunit 4